MSAFLSIYERGTASKSYKTAEMSLAGRSLHFVIQIYQNDFYKKHIGSDAKALDYKVFGINDEPFKYSFSTSWGEGPAAKAADKLNSFVKADAIKILAGNNFIGLPATDGWSQKFAHDGAPLSLDLSFKIYSTGFGKTTKIIADRDPGSDNIVDAIRFFTLITVPPFRYNLLNLGKKVEGMLGKGTEIIREVKKSKDRSDEAKKLESIIQNTLKKIGLQEDSNYSFKNDDWSSAKASFVTECKKLNLETINETDFQLLFDKIQEEAFMKYNFLKDKGVDYTELSNKRMNATDDQNVFTAINIMLQDEKMKNMLAYKNIDQYSGFLDGVSNIFDDQGLFASGFAERYIDSASSGDYTAGSDSGSLINTVEKALTHAKDFLGFGDTWKHNARGAYTVSIKTNDMTDAWNEFDWYIKSFSFKPSIQTSPQPNSEPIYIQCNVSLETTMALTNHSLYRLFIDPRA